MSEHDEQVAVVEWASWACHSIPELELLFAIPNGGHRHPAVANKLKAEGVRSGLPDLMLPVPADPYFGLFIEMKTGKNRPSDTQNRWIKDLRKQGYRVEVCYGWEAARDVLLDYLSVG